MSLSWLAYVPIPGLAFVPAVVEGHDRFARFHAWQGGTLVAAFWLGLVMIGFLGRISDASGYQSFIGSLSLVWILAGFTGIGFGLAFAIKGTYGRVRPVYDVLALLRR